MNFAAASFLSGLEPKRLKQCPNCAMLFLLESKRRKRFCTDSCRSQYHNRIRVESGKQALYICFGVVGDTFIIEAVKRLPEILPFFQNCQPTQPGLLAFQNQELKQALVIMKRNTSIMMKEP